MEYYHSMQKLVGQYEQILQIGRGKDNALIKNYRNGLQNLAEKFKYAKAQKQRPLTIPEIFSRSFDENFISTYLAYILNPQKNGVGIAPLEALLRICEIDTTRIAIEDVNIYREKILENGRIDLFLEWQDCFILGIENKIYSPEGESQTLYYARVMHENPQDIPYRLIFLTRFGQKAQSEEFISISYKQLHDAFKEIPTNENWHHRKLSLWEDFLEHLEVYIMDIKADKFEFSDKAKLYIENCKMLVDLEATFKRDWKEVFDFLENQFTSRAIDGPWLTEFVPRYYWHEAFKPHWKLDNLYIHYEWWFDFSRFKQKKIQFMVDLDGKLKDEALALFDNHHKDFEKTFKQLGITYRPKSRNKAIAFKEFSIEQDINQIADVFIKSFEEFRFLEPVIDEVIMEMKNKK